MRLQLTARAIAIGAAGAIGILAALPAGRALAQASTAPAFDARAGVYQDTDRTFIFTATGVARGTIKDRVTIRGRYLIDVVTSASVDVISAATPGSCNESGEREGGVLIASVTQQEGFCEERHEFEGGAGYDDGTRRANASYVFSAEPDWTSHSFRIGGSLDILDHSITIGIGGSLTLNDVGRADDASFHRDLRQITGSAELSHVADRNNIWGASFTVMALSGFQASPYRFVFIDDPSSAVLDITNPETHPDARYRFALGARWNRHVFSDSSIRSHARGYIDTWGVASGTAGVEYVIGFGKVDVGILARGYYQTSAAFYEPRYLTRIKYMTADRELSTFADVFGGLRAGYRGSPVKFLSELRADVKVEGFAFHFFDYPRLVDRTGIVADLGIGASF